MTQPKDREKARKPAEAAPAAADPNLPSLPFRVASIAGRTSTHVRFRPSAPERAAIAQALDLLDLPAMEFDGEIRPSGKRDLVLKGKLNATVVQPCSVTLEPVTTKIDEQVARQYLQDFTLPEADEVEIPADDTMEPLPEVIDAAAVAVEALALALPLYPRAPGVELGEAVFTEPGKTALRQDDLKPFAGLAGLVLKPKGDADESR